MKCSAIVPARWHTPAHACSFEATNGGLCATHARMRCDHQFRDVGQTTHEGFRALVYWCAKCGSLRISQNEGAYKAIIRHPATYPVALDVGLKVGGIE